MISFIEGEAAVAIIVAIVVMVTFYSWLHRHMR